MTSSGEFGGALFVMGLALFSLGSKYWHWANSKGGVWKGLSIVTFPVLMCGFVFAYFWINDMRGNSPWSHAPNAYDAMLIATTFRLEILPNSHLSPPSPPAGWDTVSEEPNPLPAAQPDLTAKFVYPDEIALELKNDSLAPITHWAVFALIFDLDRLQDAKQPLHLQFLPAGDGFIRSHSSLVPTSIAANSGAKGVVKKRDRLFGWVSVTCEKCITSHAYWVYAVNGADGWYVTVPPGRTPQLNVITENWDTLLANTQAILDKNFPQKNRIIITNSVP